MITCVRLPHFATAFEEREHPELSGTSFVLVDDGLVSGVSPQAARAGVRAGMGLAQAHARCDDLQVRPAVPSRTQRAFDDLLEGLTVFSAAVEAEDGLELRADARRWRNVTFLNPSQLDDYPAATCYLDLGTLPIDEAPALAQQVQQFVWEQAHIPAKLGLSSGKFPARVAATSVNAGEMLVVPGGHETHFLSGFTVALLPVDGETLRQLDLLGWHTLGDVAAQPVAALLDRFGKQGRIMHRLVNGRDSNPVQRYEPAAVARVVRQCEGVTDWARLALLLDDMVTQAVTQFETAQTVRQVTLVLLLDDGTALDQQLVLRQPTGSIPHLQDAVREMAQSLAVTAGVVELDLALSDIAPAVPKQLSLFERDAVPQAHLSTVLKDLVARYGDAHFHWARVVDRDARLPERRYRWEKAGHS